MKVAIIGAGAIGCFYGYQLMKANVEVYIQTQFKYKDPLKNGITIHSPWGGGQFYPNSVKKTASELSELAVFDYVLVTTKVYPSIDFIALLTPVVTRNTTIVLIQNGLGIDKRIAAYFKTNTVISGLAFICVTRDKSGHIIHEDYGRLVLGRYPQGECEQTKALVKRFTTVKVPCQITTTILEARWKKLIWNAAFNPLSVISGGLTTQALLSESYWNKKIRAIMTEVCEVAAVVGIQLESSLITKNINDTEKMTPYKTSMLVDHQADRELETEAILGDFIGIAHQNQVKVPESEWAYHKLNALTSSNPLTD